MLLQKLLITKKVIKYYDRIRLFTVILIFTKEMGKKKHLCWLHMFFHTEMVTKVRKRVQGVFFCETNTEF